MTYDYQKVFEEYECYTISAMDEAIKKFPSKHLVDDDESWFEMLEKQSNYAHEKIDAWLLQLKDKYLLTDEDWKKLVLKLKADDSTLATRMFQKMREEGKIP